MNKLESYKTKLADKEMEALLYLYESVYKNGQQYFTVLTPYDTIYHAPNVSKIHGGLKERIPTYVALASLNYLSINSQKLRSSKDGYGGDEEEYTNTYTILPAAIYRSEYEKASRLKNGG